MPQTFITKNQRRGHEFARAVENYIFESGETKLNLREVIPCRRLLSRRTSAADTNLLER